MEKHLGKWGESLWRKSQGIGSTEIVTDWEQKSMSHENTFDKDYNDVEFYIKNWCGLLKKLLWFKGR